MGPEVVGAPCGADLDTELELQMQQIEKDESFSLKRGEMSGAGGYIQGGSFNCHPLKNYIFFTPHCTAPLPEDRKKVVTSQK